MLPFLSDIRRAIAGNTTGSLWWDKTDKAMKQKIRDATKHSCIGKLTDFIPQTYCVVKFNCLPPPKWLPIPLPMLQWDVMVPAQYTC